MRFLNFLLEKVSDFFVTLSCLLLSFQVSAGQHGYFNPIMSTSVQSEGLHSVGTPPINDAHVDLFANNIYHVSQQEGSLLMPFVLVEGMVMNAKQINRIGTLGDPNLYRGRGSKVTATNPQNDNRWLTAQRYWHACFVDNWDQIRTLWDIRNAYSEAIAMSFGRLQDRVIIAAALGTVWAGPNRTQQISLPLDQKYAAFASGDQDGTGLNLDTLRVIRKRMKKSFAARRGAQIIMVITAEETDSLLRVDKITNRDFTTILSLMAGEISAFYGFIFVETQLVPHTSADVYYNLTSGKQVATGAVGTNRTHAAADNTPKAGFGRVVAGKGLRCFAFMSGDSLCFGINQNMMARVSERDDLHYNIQIYYAAEFGAVRKEEVKVIEVVTRDSDIA